MFRCKARKQPNRLTDTISISKETDDAATKLDEEGELVSRY